MSQTMKIAYYLLPAIFYLPAGIYFYHFFKRFLSLFHMEGDRKSTKILALIFSVGCAAWGWRVYGLGAVVVLHFLAACLLVELVGWILSRVGGSVGESKIWRFLYRSGILSLVLTTAVFGYGFVNMGRIHRTAYEIQTEKRLEKDLKIVQVSDLHMGTTMGGEKLSEYCWRIEREKPDLLALTGDIFDERTTKEEMETAARLLGGVKTTYGVYYVFGNHDYNSYTPEPAYTAEELCQTLEKEGICVLEDRAVTVGPHSGLTIIGRRDASKERGKTGQLLAEGTDQFHLLLDHQPVDLEENARDGIDLQLSGHTHAGQIWPTGQLGELTGIVECNYGLKTLGDYHLIVSSGIGGWGYPIRTGGHCEYVVITVTQDS